jgi:hypothetical protein
MCHHGPLGYLFKAAKLIVALTAINIGLAAMGWFDIYQLDVMLTNPHLVKGLALVIGISGALVLFGCVKGLMMCMNGSCNQCMPRR